MASIEKDGYYEVGMVLMMLTAKDGAYDVHDKLSLTTEGDHDVDDKGRSL